MHVRDICDLFDARVHDRVCLLFLAAVVGHYVFRARVIFSLLKVSSVCIQTGVWV